MHLSFAAYVVKTVDERKYGNFDVFTSKRIQAGFHNRKYLVALERN